MLEVSVLEDFVAELVEAAVRAASDNRPELDMGH